MDRKLPRVEQLKARTKSCCCSFCGGELSVKRVLLQTSPDWRIELYCDTCEKIEYGVPQALFDSAKAAVERLGFNYYPEMEAGATRTQMNISKLATLTSWQLRYAGLDDDERLGAPVAVGASGMDATTVVADSELDELLKEVESWLIPQSGSNE